MLAHARPNRLKRTLASLLEVRGLDRERTFIVQDGNNAEVSRLVRSVGLRLVRLPLASEAERARDAREVEQGVADTSEVGLKGARIAKAYGRALSHAFDRLTDDEAVVVVEDDLLFSADLMEFFLAGFHVMSHDPTIWCVSAWNDNGFGGLVGNGTCVRRTGYFPGLGWLLSRRLFKEELEPKWPSGHWDHWMRSETVHRTSKGRECLYPEVPRTFHHGAQGTFMDDALHKKYFAPIAHNRDRSVSWPPAAYAGLRAALSAAAYESALRERIRRARPVRAAELAELVAGDGGGGSGGAPLAIWYTQAPRPSKNDAGQRHSLFKEIAAFVGIWHEPRRSSHEGVHEFQCLGRPLLLVNTLVGADNHASPYCDLQVGREAAGPWQASTTWTSVDEFRRAVKKAAKARAVHRKARAPLVGVCRGGREG